jgi:hypothetical protein
MSRPLKVFSTNLTFDNNSSTSSTIETKNRTLVAITTPAALTNSSFALETSEDGSTNWAPVYKADGSQVTITVATNAARFIQLDLEGTNACRWIRLKGVSNEGGARTLRAHLRIVR